MLNEPLLVGAIRYAPPKFSQGHWHDGKGGLCVVAWLCQFFHWANPERPQIHENEGPAISKCVVESYGIYPHRVEALAELNDATIPEYHRVAVLDALEDLIKEESAKQKAIRRQLFFFGLSLPPVVTIEPAPCNIYEQANEIVETSGFVSSEEALIKANKPELVLIS